MIFEEAQAVTARWLEEAGLAPGDRVLDVGCGPGNVTGLLLARVGGAGAVVGLDRHDGLLAAARARHGDRATFVAADLLQPLPAELGTFDAVVARRVLMYLPDPAAVLRRLLALLRPGGLVFVQEFVLADGPHAGLPLHDQVAGWLRRMLEREGASSTFGLRLPSLFADAGLPWPVVRAEVDVAAPGQPDTIADRIRMVAPRLIEAGVPTDDIGIDTLAERLQNERQTAREQWMAETMVAAWSRVP
ncbi:methyltransferase [Hyaloraphidium curvatum]|nr:methyltransferase [Hyaloraphidium curvatum]